MRRLIKRIKGRDTQTEHGATAVMTALLLVVLLAFAAIAIDVGVLYAKRAELQNGADSAALAIAQDCAKGDCSPAGVTPESKAATLGVDNANGDSQQAAAVEWPTSNSVTVQVNKNIAAGNGVQLFFAGLLGHSQADVGATATAAWGPPSTGTTLPWTFGKCVFESSLSPAQISELNTTGNFTADPSNKHLLIRYDKYIEKNPYPGCEDKTVYPSGGFGWLDLVGGKCEADITVGSSEEGTEATAGSDPGNNFPPACASVLSTLLNRTLLIPIFESQGGTGAGATYKIYGFAAFTVTGWRVGGGPAVTHPDSDLSITCTGNCRGFSGFFQRFVSLDDGIAVGAGTDLGATVVRLTN